MSFLRSLAAVTFGLSLTAAASAQFSSVPNSGCPGGSSITTAGTPQIGMTVTYTWYCLARSDVPFLMFGPAVPPVFSLPMPVACVANCFLIHPAPPLLLSGPSGRGLIIPVPIPQDASLIGQSIHTQGGCVTTATCIYLGFGLATKVQ